MRRMWNKKIIVQLDVTFRQLSGGGETISEDFSHRNLISGPKHEARVTYNNCIVVGSRRLMPPDALQPKAYCTKPGL